MARLSTLKSCPQCPHQNLIPVEMYGQVLDTCARCHGLWFEARELEAAWMSAHGQLPAGRAILEEKHAAWGEPLTQPAQLACPDCGTRLQPHHISPQFLIELARCPACEGVWVEEGQRCATYHAPTVSAALSRIVKPINWRVFLFQLITRLPLEFNMKPRSTPWVNWGLIIINLAIYLVTVIEPDIYLLGAVVPAQIIQGQGVLTLITHQFWHGDLHHLFGNMFFLYLVGDNLEDMLGHFRYLGIYVFSGIIAGLCHILADTGSAIPMIGASGSIAAMFGLYLLWFRRARLTFMIIVYQIKVAPWVFFLVWVVNQFIGLAWGEQGIAYMAHLGGFSFGLIAGWLGYNGVLRKNPLLAHLNGPLIKIPGSKTG